MEFKYESSLPRHIVELLEIVEPQAAAIRIQKGAGSVSVIFDFPAVDLSRQLTFAFAGPGNPEQEVKDGIPSREPWLKEAADAFQNHDWSSRECRANAAACLVKIRYSEPDASQEALCMHLQGIEDWRQRDLALRKRWDGEGVYQRLLKVPRN